jgi:Fe-S-cluster containining protein
MTNKKFDKVINGFFVDPIIFTQKFVKACDVCTCSGECCYYGVYTDKADYEKILSVRDRIIRYMDDSQIKDFNLWFEEPEEDSDFPSGIAVGTEVYNNKCVFLDKQGFCTLQKMAVAEGEFKWKYKPLYCILFPLVIFEGVLTVDDEHLERMHYCNRLQNQVSTVYDCCKDELRYLLGEKGFEELAEYRTEYFLKTNGVESGE